MTFVIFYDKQPLKFLKKLDKHLSSRILDKIDELLTENPVPHSSKAVVGEHGVFRIRIGDYRTLYRVDFQSKKIVVFKLDKRPRVYDKK